MKRTIFKLVFYIHLSLLFIGALEVNAQTSNLLINLDVPTGIVVCEEAQIFSVKLKNIGTNPMKDLKITYQLPDGFIYAGDISDPNVLYQTTSGTIPNKPIFLFATSPLSFAVNAELEFTFKATASCAAIASYKLANPNASGEPKVRNFINVEYLIGQTSFLEQKQGGTNSYNLLFADLNITISGQYTPLAAYNREKVIRQFKVKNTGFGKTSKVIIKLDYEIGLQHNFLRYLGATQSLGPHASSTTSQFIYEITDFAQATINGIPATTTSNYFDKDEEIVFEEEVQPVSCNLSLNTVYEVSYGCNSDKCNMSDRTQTFSFINVEDGKPAISIETLSDVKGNFCTENLEVKYKLTSTGFGNDASLKNSTRNLKIYFYQRNVESESNYAIYLNGIKTTFTSLGINLIVDGDYRLFNLDNHPTLFNNNIDGSGGLEDIDGDGYFDDLKTNDYIIISVEVDYTCPGNLCNSGKSFSYHSLYANGSSTCSNVEVNLAVNQYDFNFYDNDFPKIVGNPDVINLSPVRFQFSINKELSSTNGFITCTDNIDNYYSEIILPSGYSLVDLNDVKFYNDPTSFQFIDPSKIIFNSTTRVLKIEYGKRYGYYDIPLVLDCSSGGVSELATLQWDMYYRCLDGCSTCSIKIVCNSYELFNHCPNCSNGITTSSFNVDRTTLGWPDPTTPPYYTYGQWQALPRLTNTAGLRLDRAFEYDDIKAVTIGNIKNVNNYSNVKLDIEYSSPLSEISEILIAKGYSIIINNNTSACYTSNAEPTKIITGNTVKYTIDFPDACRNSGNVYAPNTDVKVILNYQANELPNTVAQQIYYNLSRFRARFSAKTASGSYESCESFGDNFTVIKYFDQGNGAAFGLDLNCNDSYVINQVAWAGASRSIDDFPNEYRPYARIEEATVTAPPNYTVVASKSSYVDQKYYEVVQSTIIGNLLGAFTTPQLGNIYNFKRKNDWILAEHSAWEDLFYAIRPNCKPNKDQWGGVVNSDFTFTKYIYATNPSDFKTITYNQSCGYTDNFTTYIKVYPDEFQEGYTDEVRWPIRVCNENVPGVHTTATKTYIALEPPVGTIDFQYALDENNNTIPVYKKYTTPVSSQNTIFVIGDIPIGTCEYINVVAKYSNCEENKTETIKTYVNSVCGDDPVPLSRSTANACGNNDVVTDIFLKYKTTDFVYEVIPITAQPVDICAPFKYRVIYRSTGYSDVSNLTFGLRLPKGADLKSNSFTIFYNGTYTNILNNVSVSGFVKSYNWNLSSIPPLSVNNPSGNLVGFRDLNKAVLTFDFELQTDCNFNPGQTGDEEDAIQFNVQGNTNCSKVVNDKFDQFIRINGFDPLDNMEVQMTSPSNQFGVDNQQATLMIKVINKGNVPLGQTVPTADRRLRIRLPQGVSVVSSDQQQSGAPVNKNGSFYYYWTIPPLNPGQSQNYTVTIKNDNFNTAVNGNQIPINASSIMANDANCTTTSTQCNLEAVTAFDNVVMIIPSDFCKNCIPRFAPISGKKYLVSAWVKESNSPNPTQYNNASIKLHFEGPDVTIGPFKAKGDIIDGWQRIEAEFIVPENTAALQILFDNAGATGNNIFFDDVRIHPFNSNMKSFVYDPYSLRLAAELDENNYATFYEYDEEGGLIRVKKETEKGVKTIQESRSNTSKRP